MINMTTLSPAEKAYVESGGNADPYPGEKVETADGATEETKTTEADDGGGVGGEGGADKKAEEPDPKDGEGDADTDEEVEVVNKEGETRRKMIAFGAYEKQRKEAKAAKEELAKLRERAAYLEGLQQSAKPAPQQQAQPQELSLTPPDKTKEPEKYLHWLETAAAKALQFEQQNKQQSEQTTQFQQLNQMVMEHEHAFVNGDGETEGHPDFYDAVKYLQDKHRAELKEAGYEPHEIQQIMAARAQSVAVKALQAGKSPAERVYSLAKLNGYKKAAPAKVETEAEKIARQAKNQEKAGKSISDLPGGESKGLTWESLANMDPLQFAEEWGAKNSKLKQVVGWRE